MSSLKDLLFHLNAVESKLLFIAKGRKQEMCFPSAFSTVLSDSA